MTAKELNIQIMEARRDVAAAQFNLADQNLKRADKLKAEDAIASSDYDKCVCAYRVAKATLSEAEANLELARMT
jgi:multidrug resistance efflux pump